MFALQIFIVAYSNEMLLLTYKIMKLDWTVVMNNCARTCVHRVVSTWNTEKAYISKFYTSINEKWSTH